MSKLYDLIKKKERPCFPFVPGEAVYTATGINRKRFGMILSGQTEPKVAEAKAILNFFDIPTTEFFND